MTPMYRNKLLRNLGIGMLLAAVGLFVGIRGASPVLMTVGIVATVGYFVVVGLQVAISQCPRCGCLVDLREGEFTSPRCGVWIPPAKGTPPAGGYPADAVDRAAGYAGEAFLSRLFTLASAISLLLCTAAV